MSEVNQEVKKNPVITPKILDGCILLLKEEYDIMYSTIKELMEKNNNLQKELQQYQANCCKELNQSERFPNTTN